MASSFKKDLDLLTDIDMLLMVEKGIKRGMCHAIHRYGKANNKYMKGYDKNKKSLYLKVGLSPSKKINVTCFIEGPLKMKKNSFYFILKALFVLKIFKFLSRRFGHVGKIA